MTANYALWRAWFARMGTALLLLGTSWAVSLWVTGYREYVALAAFVASIGLVLASIPTGEFGDESKENP